MGQLHFTGRRSAHLFHSEAKADRQSKVLTGGLAEQLRAIPTAAPRNLRLAGVMRMFPARAPLKAIDLNAARRMQLYVEKLEELPAGPLGR
jgi:hypothetical protein